MARIGIVVEYRIKEGQWAALNTLLHEHADRTLDEEPGCESFEVLQPLTADGAPDHGRLMLFETYEDMAAVEKHRANPRLPQVRAAAAALLDQQTLTLCSLDD